MQQIETARLVMTPGAVVRRALAVALGAALVALSAQVAVPLPGTPVPVTLQVPAVLIVGGLLGPRLGALSMVVYLASGVAGVPVFAPTGVPGLARLFGPTGGYLLAYPLAAAVVGTVVRRSSAWPTIAVALVGGLVAIHLGGVAQLTILSGDVRAAVALGSVPFLLLDVVKLLFAGLVIRRFGNRTRALT